MSPWARPVVPREVLREFPGAPEPAVPAGALCGVRYAVRPPDGYAPALVAFLERGLATARAVGMRRFVVGFSGGLDSVVSARLCQLASGSPSPVRAVVVDLGRPGEHHRVASILATAERLGVEVSRVDGAAIRASTVAAWPEQGIWSPINIDTRIIQSLIFQVADSIGGAVVATTDLSERLLGRFTEHFYGHLEPLGSTYKTEVAALARELGIDVMLAGVEAGCEDHWLDLDVLGAGYEVIDPLLHLLCVEKLSPAAICERHGIADVAWVDRLARRVVAHRARITSSRP